MKVFMVLLLWFVWFTEVKSEALCRTNYEHTTNILTPQIIAMLGSQETNLIVAINKYKEALEKKREMMNKLWKTVTEIEYLMKENQVLRKKMIEHWEDVRVLPSVM